MEEGAEIVADAAKEGEALGFACLKRRGVGELAVNHARCRWVNGAMLLGVVADGENVIEGLAGEFIHMLRALPGDVNAEFAHDGNGFAADWLGIRASAENFEAITGIVAEKAFGHLAARGISSAEDQDAQFIHAFPAV